MLLPPLRQPLANAVPSTCAFCRGGAWRGLSLEGEARLSFKGASTAPSPRKLPYRRCRELQGAATGRVWEAEGPKPPPGSCHSLVTFGSQFLHRPGTHILTPPRSPSGSEARVTRLCVKCWSPSLHIMQPGTSAPRSDYGTSPDRKWRSGNRPDNPPIPAAPNTFPVRTGRCQDLRLGLDGCEPRAGAWAKCVRWGGAAPQTK